MNKKKEVKMETSVYLAEASYSIRRLSKHARKPAIVSSRNAFRSLSFFVHKRGFFAYSDVSLASSHTYKRLRSFLIIFRTFFLSFLPLLYTYIFISLAWSFRGFMRYSRDTSSSRGFATICLGLSSFLIT